jgi:hypothetical protein
MKPIHILELPHSPLLEMGVFLWKKIYINVFKVVESMIKNITPSFF